MCPLDGARGAVSSSTGAAGPTLVADADAPAAFAAAKAAAALMRWEDDMETLSPEPATNDAAEIESGAQIALHHFFHGCFLPEDGALPELRGVEDTLRKLPCVIVHGRHDVICPPKAAHDVHCVWPGST